MSSCSNSRCWLTRHGSPSRTVISHRWHAVCFSLFLSACLRLMIQISDVHPDLYRTSPLIQPFSRCHHLVNWSFPDVSSWHSVQTVTWGCGIPGPRLLFASRWQISGYRSNFIRNRGVCTCASWYRFYKCVIWVIKAGILWYWEYAACVIFVLLYSKP